jgi:acyl-CoA thioester hydrolase
MHLDARKLIAPPPQLLAVMNKLEKTEDFVVLPSSIKAT